VTIFYQHIGEKLSERDFPKSLGSKDTGLVRFQFDEIAADLEHLPGIEIATLKSTLERLAPTGFQIWGIPSGAARVLNRMETGDFLMLLESISFGYIGQVLHKVSLECRELSTKIWGEHKFPIIIFLQGEMISYDWEDFRDSFGFKPNYHMRGNTMSLAAAKVQSSTFKTEENFVAHVLTSKGINAIDLEKDFSAYADNLKRHLSQVSLISRKAAFRRDVAKLNGMKCAVCDMDIAEVLDAAHLVAKKTGGSDDPRNGIMFCSNHHRLFDARMFYFDPETSAVLSNSDVSIQHMKIKHSNLTHLENRPPRKVLEAAIKDLPK